MRALVQRVTDAEVRVDSEVVGEIGAGLCILIGVTHSDDEGVVAAMARKLCGLRIFDDAAGAMSLGIDDVGGQMLIISQFTLYGDVTKGRRPSWSQAARPEVAEPLIAKLVDQIRATGTYVTTGVFGADMSVRLCNDGPVTLMIEV